MKIGIIGLGLMGGSFSIEMRRLFPNSFILGNDISHIKLEKCTDLKIVVPTAVPIDKILNKVQYKNLYFQPKDEGDNGISNVELALKLATRYNGKLSVQTHKMVGLR